MPSNSSVLTLDGDFGQVDPETRAEFERFELPATRQPVKYKKKLSPSPPRKADPLPTNPKTGDCACRWNGKKRRWTKLCFVGKGSGKGQSRSGWIIKRDTTNSCVPTTKSR
jgi:hypothetical protein